MISIRDRALVGKHDTVGRAYLCLDPKRFGDYLTHELWMDLDSQGRILIRVSMEGEMDDIQFYFGRAFRSLKRAEADMVRIFIDKVGYTIKLWHVPSFTFFVAPDGTVHSTIPIAHCLEDFDQGRPRGA